MHSLYKSHTAKVGILQNQIKHIQPLRQRVIYLERPQTHSTRLRKKTVLSLNLGTLNKIIAVDAQKREAVVEPGVTMEQLVRATLQYGLIPPVVPEFPGITVGGAIQGAALESSSFAYGQFSDCCSEDEVLTGDGKLIIASPREHADLFWGMSGAYGSLGIITAVRIHLIPSSRFVRLIYIPVYDRITLVALLEEKIRNAKATDYIEGMLFSPTCGVVIVGTRENTNPKHLPVQTFRRASDPWYYRHARAMAAQKATHEELVPLIDYLFRYDRGAFWMGEFALDKIPCGYNRFNRTILNSLLRTSILYELMHCLESSQTLIIQDAYIPMDNVVEFLERIDRTLGIYPLWFCPVKPTRQPEKLSPHYSQAEMLINIGIYGKPSDVAFNHRKMICEIEHITRMLNGRKMLFAHTYISSEEFWEIYDEDWYSKLRQKYSAHGFFSDVFSNVHTSEEYTIKRVSGIVKFLWRMSKKVV